MKSEKIKNLEKKYIMQTYGRFPITADHGSGQYVFDTEGKKYLDFLGGIATCPVGHNNPAVTGAISEQAAKLINMTNLFYTEPQARLAERLVKISGLQGKVFFSNSGTEANEAAIKIARKFTGKYGIISAKFGFHGRTFGALAATWKAKFKKSFRPMLPGFSFVEYGNVDAVSRAISKNTAAVMVEPIQGEAGIVLPPKGYLKKLAALCKKKKVLLIVDEVQTGAGRTGKFFAYQHDGIKPDIVTIAKGLGNGIPIGATIANRKVADCLQKGDHGSTFGGNSLCCAAAFAAVDYIQKHNLPQNAKAVGDYFIAQLRKLESEDIKEVRGKGLMIGMQMKMPCKDIVNNLVDGGLLCVCTNENVVRFLPPLIITEKDVDSAMKIIKGVLS